LSRFAPAGVLINAHWQVLQFRGDTSPFLKPPAGHASFQVLKMAREGLVLPLRASIHKSKKENKAVRREGVRVDHNGDCRTVNFEVVPLKQLEEQCFLIFFEETKSADGQQTKIAPAAKVATRLPREARDAASRRVAELERELVETREYLQSIQEQAEAANEELQSSNEEVTSANEELQSINEELETSKEELESANEELTTVNDEMATRNTELNRYNADLNNLHASVNMAVLLLTRELTIRHFTPVAEKVFNLVESDIGRPLKHVRHNLNLTDLEELLTEVIETVRERQREVQDRQGRWFSLRIRPYRTLDNRIDGAVLVLHDIDAVKRSEQEIAAARDRAEAILRTTRYPLVVLTPELYVSAANAAFYKTFQVSADKTIGRLIYELGNHQWDIPKLRELLEDILVHNSSFEDFEITHDFENIGPRTMLLNARRLDTDDHHGPQKHPASH
jgi:two-component system CheB/CheR fusion protein